ncbi:Gaa1-domain-containing protein [Leucogyrophana mollusca]|uniref:Gaa1-domain-containing protein n=1 Tax=Leucogyrophana mollusca TaxID=85980 RepID=A0ACB8BW74_9AGAM|nr:Gaa1-domain-containing protein [Leucogyrophana mollusca]
MIIIPIPALSQRTYIDENALQPAQVNTYWNWADVHRADQHLYQLEALRDRNSTHEQRALFVRNEFSKLGLAASTQNYEFSTSSGPVNGTNAYAIRASPRASGTEAIVISASWVSRIGEGDGTLNLRGISTVLSLAAFLKDHSLWAKDMIFVISDNYLDGMHAWLNAYHGTIPSNLETEPLEHTSGSIWTALNIDYSGHSFSHLGIFFEGLNGRLPNQDLMNAFRLISSYTGGVPVTVYDHFEPSEFPDKWDEMSMFPSWIPSSVRKNAGVQEYSYRTRNVARHIGYQARGKASGVHGLLHKFRIDAITLYAVPAAGPHGFHALGRVIESTLRTANNLLERLHASFFFFIFTSPGTFMKIGTFLPSAVIVSVAMMFGGLGEWVDAGTTLQKEVLASKSEVERPIEQVKWTPRRRPVLPAIVIMIITHIMGLLLFFLISSPSFCDNQLILSPVLFGLFSILPPIILSAVPQSPPTAAPLSMLLKSLNLCLSSTIISITSVLNFSLAATLAVTLGLPLTLATPSSNVGLRFTKYAGYCTLAMGWMVLLPRELENAIWNWQVLGVWFAPFVCIVYMPLVMQAGLVTLHRS